MGVDRRFGMKLFSVLFVLLAVSSGGIAQPWPSFRGANSAGIADDQDLPVEWDIETGRNLRWRTAIPGLAHSSPIVWGERVYVTTAISKGDAPEPILGSVDTAGIDSAADQASHQWRLYALNKSTGKVIWERVLHEGIPRVKRHVKSSHASATPVTNGKRIVTLIGSEGLFCFDMEGQLLWKQDLGVLDVGLVDDPSYQWGPASSPILHAQLVIVQNDRHEESFLAAYELGSGKLVWKTSRDEMPSWATPVVYRGDKGVELITNSPRYLRGYDPLSGKLLWQLFDDDTQVKVVSPIVAGETIFITGGYPTGQRPIYAIRPGGRGDITLDNGATTNDQVRWKQRRGSPYTPTPLAYRGLLYVLIDNGILSTYNLETGERVYRERLARDSSGFSASPVASDGKIYFTSEDGDVFIVEAGEEFELLGRNSMEEVIMATPAISDRLLFLRGRGHLFAIGKDK
jgi:outer membrane protein assembly factor BamB